MSSTYPSKEKICCFPRKYSFVYQYQVDTCFILEKKRFKAYMHTSYLSKIRSKYDSLKGVFIERTRRQRKDQLMSQWLDEGSGRATRRAGWLRRQPRL
jgi:hypothetical protein